MRKPKRLKHELNVVPYIDVMLVLLVIFMVAAPLIPQGKIDIPSVSHASEPAPQALEINLLGEQRLRLFNRQTQFSKDISNFAELIHLLREQQQPQQAVIIAADKSMRYGYVVDLLDRLQSAGIARVGLMVEQKQPSS